MLLDNSSNIRGFGVPLNMDRSQNPLSRMPTLKIFGQTNLISRRRPNPAANVTSTGESYTEQLSGENTVLHNFFGERGEIKPSEIERTLEVSLTKRDIEDSINGKKLMSLGEPNAVLSAKSDILKAIDEIAKAEHVQITQDDKEKLANFSIYLLKRVGSVI